MNTGMLWFDNDPKTALDDKVRKAANYYLHKYGRNPDLCLVNPASLAKNNLTEPILAGQIQIRPLRSVLPGHLWIGVDEKLPAVSD